MENSEVEHKNLIDDAFEIYDFPPEELLKKNQDVLHLGDIIFSEDFKNNHYDIPIVLGKDSDNKNVILDLSNLPHLLIAGTTGVGKSTFLDSILISMLYTCKPSKLKLILVDTRGVNFSKFDDIFNLVTPVITKARTATAAFCWLIQEMENRYNLFMKKNVRDIKSYNKIVKDNEKLSKVVVVIDDFFDLILEEKNELENIIYKLTRLGRGAGIHLIISTQRPSSDIISEKIKANIPARIAFKVVSKIDSKIIIGTTGAENLSSKGEILYKNGNIEATKIQVPYISDDETLNVLKFIKGQETDCVNIIDDIHNINEQNTNNDEEDPLLQEAIEYALEVGQASVSMFQRKFKIDYSRAERLIDKMHERGIVSGFEGSESRKILINSANTEIEDIDNNVKSETQIPINKILPKKEAKTNYNQTSEWNIYKLLAIIVLLIVVYIFLIVKDAPKVLKIIFVIWSVLYCLKKTLPTVHKIITQIALLLIFSLIILSILGVFGEFPQYLAGFLLFIFVLICFLGSGSNPSGWYH